MAGKRRGRTGRGWDAAPPRARRAEDAAGRGRPRGGRAAQDGDPPPGTPAGSTPASRTPTGGTPAGGEPALDPAEHARDICLQLLAGRPRTRAELATALRRGGIAEEVAAGVLERYADVGMIDDAAFARAWVSSRHHSRGLARRALGSELRQRGIAPEIVGEALGELDATAEAATARALVDRKLRTARGEPQAVVRRLVGMLARKGYPAGLAFRVVKEAIAADERTAALAEQLDPDAMADAVGDDPGT